MEHTAATSHRPAAIQRGLEEGKVSRVKIGEKFYLIFKVEDGQITENPITSPEKLEKIQTVAKLALDIHKAAVSSDPSLKNKEIIQLSNLGATFSGDHIPYEHASASVTSAEDYLKATNDFAWQQEVIDLEQHLDTLDDEDKVSVRALPPSIQHYLSENDHRETSYSPGDLEDYLLDYAREKVQKTHFVDAQLEDDELEKELETNYDWVMRFDTAEKLINVSNRTIQQHFTAEHVWQTLVNIISDTTPSIHRPPEDDLSSTGSRPRSSSVSSSEYSSDEERGRTRTRSTSSSRERSRTPSRSTTPSSSRFASPERSRSQSPSPSPRPPQRADSAKKPQRGSRIIILDEASIFPRETMATSSMKPRGQYMPREKGRLTLAYRDLLPQINGPLAVEEADYQGAYDKLHRFQEDSERVDLEPLSQQELVAIRNAHNRVMEIPDYKRHRDLKDARFFNAIVDQLRLKC